MTKHTLLLREGDMAFLRSQFPDIGASIVIRRLVSDFVDKLNRPVSAREVNKLVKELEKETAE